MLKDEMSEILRKIFKEVELDYHGNFINGDYMFHLELKNLNNYGRDITISQRKCKNEVDAKIYLIITFFIECIAECRLYKDINDDSYESFKKFLYTIDDEDYGDEKEMKYLYDEKEEIYSTFMEGLDKVTFARTILNREERFKFGEFVKNSNRYKPVVKAKTNAVNKRLANY